MEYIALTTNEPKLPLLTNIGIIILNLLIKIYHNHGKSVSLQPIFPITKFVGIL